MPTPVIKYLQISSTGAFSIPMDFGSFVSVEGIGSGGAGFDNNATTTASGGGGGGGYSKSTSVTGLYPGKTVYANVGPSLDTWFNANANSAPTLSSQGILALKGSTSTSSIGGLGGQSASGVGDLKYSGGQGGTGQTASGCGGGGGAAGPGGNGGNGFAGSNQGAGGGGSAATLTAAGTIGSNGTSTTGGNGGASTGQTGGTGAPSNSVQATTGLNGGGGGGGFGTTVGGVGVVPATAGSGSPIWPGISVGPHGGSGGCGQGAAGTQIISGPGGGSGGGDNMGSTLALGILVFTYYTATQFQSREGDLEQLFVTDYDMIDQYASTGSLWNWGRNAVGQLGDNTRVDKSSPVQTVSGGTNWKSVKGGYTYTAAIKTDGTLWTWGNNANGQLGDNSITHRSSPVQTVAGGTNWKLVASGNYHTACIKTDGTLWTWGINTNGQVGDNSITHRSSPVQTVAGGTNWKLVGGGDYHTTAIFFYEAGKLYPPS
jgi:hypothetical protein